MTDFERNLEELRRLGAHFIHPKSTMVMDWAIAELEELARIRLALASICPRLVHPETEQKESES